MAETVRAGILGPIVKRIIQVTGARDARTAELSVCVIRALRDHGVRIQAIDNLICVIINAPAKGFVSKHLIAVECMLATFARIILATVFMIWRIIQKVIV
jgi:hypothetical protein